MRHSKRAVLAALIVFALCAFAVISLAPSTTSALQQGNNTSASSTFSSIADARAGVLTNFYLPQQPSNVSTMPIKNLMYPGATTLTMVNVMPWFRSDAAKTGCTNAFGGVGGWSVSRPAFQGHWCNGYNSVTNAGAQVADIKARGFDGAIITWEGVNFNSGAGQKPEEATTLGFRSQDVSLCRKIFANDTEDFCPQKYVILYDGSALNGSKGFAGTPAAPNGTSLTTTSDENALLAKLKDDVCYMNKFHFVEATAPDQSNFGAGVYLTKTDQSGFSRPVLQFFITEQGNTTGAAPSWADLWSQFHTFIQALPSNCAAFNATYSTGEFNNGVPWLEFGTGSAAFTRDGLTNGTTGVVQGAYAWENMSGTGVSTQSSNITTSLNSLDSFYKAALTFSRSEAWGAVFAGFDDKLAGWSPNAGCTAGSDCVGAGRIEDKACGTTWVNSIKKIGQYYSSANQLQYVGVVTWNDYDEGTAIEPGIDNCYRVNASLSGSTLNWSLTTVNGLGSPVANAKANIETVDHMEVYAAFDATNWGALTTSIAPALNGSLDLSSFTTLAPGTYDIYVKMVGVNSIVNHTTRAGTFTVIASPTGGTGGGGGTTGGGSTSGNGTGGTTFPPAPAPVGAPDTTVPPPQISPTAPFPPLRKPGQKSVVVIHD